MAAKIKSEKHPEAQNPLILRCHRLMEAFAKSDDERDFYIDKLEGFLVYVDLDKPANELEALEKEIESHSDRYCMIPKLSFYETKKIMEGFVNEKVYDIDTKEKLLDIIQSKEARENFLEFIYDHHSEQEKWQQYYQERSRIRIIEWLRQNHFHFVFEEDLELPRQLLEKVKQALFQAKAGKDILNARKILVTKAKTYYSNEALNPRPKRGRPPKQAAKTEIEPQIGTDIYTTVQPPIRPFLFTPDIHTSTFSAFSSKFESEGGSRRLNLEDEEATLQQKLASLRSISSRWVEPEEPSSNETDFDVDDSEDEDFDDDDFEDEKPAKTKKVAPKKNNNKIAKAPAQNNKKNNKTISSKPAKKKILPPKKPVKKAPPSKSKKPPVKRIMPQTPSKKLKGLKKLLPKPPPRKKK